MHISEKAEKLMPVLIETMGKVTKSNPIVNQNSDRNILNKLVIDINNQTKARFDNYMILVSCYNVFS